MKYRIFVLFLCVSFVSQAKVIHVQSSKQLKEKIDQQPTVIKFSATWCGPCQMAKKPFKVVSDIPEFSHVAFVSIDTDQQQSIANSYNIQALPTFVFIRDGSIVERVEGLIGANNVSGFKQNLAAKLTSLFAQQEPASVEVQKEQVLVQEKDVPVEEDLFEAELMKEEEESVLDQISNWFNGIVEYISNAFRSLWS